MTNQTTIQHELDLLKAKYPNWDFEATFTKKHSKKDVETLIRELKQTYPNFKISKERTNFGLNTIIINVKTDEDIAYYHNDNVGYVHLNSVYSTLTNIIEDTLVNAKVFSYIDGIRNCSFEIRL
jgi:hypothetical protein